MLQNRPALKFCIPFILGIVLGWKLPLGPMAAFAVTALLLIFTVVSSRRLPRLRPAMLLLTLFSFGAAKITFDGLGIESDSIIRFVVPGKTVKVSGTIAELPSRTMRSTRFVLEADSLTIEGVGTPAVGGVLVSFWNEKADSTVLDSLTYGRRFAVEGTLAEAGSARNPGEFDLRNYLRVNNIGVRLFATSLDRSLLGKEATGNLLARLVFPVRKSVAGQIDRSIGGEEAKFLKGLLIGERSDIPAEVKTSFINAGVMHVIAVSGLHVAIVTLMLFFILQIVRIPEKGRIALISVILVYYIYLTGAAPSVARSVIMALVFLGGRLIERKSDMINTLAFSALVLLLVDAKQLFQPGFQLSFAAVFSLVALTPRLNALNKWLPRRVADSTMGRAVIAGISVSVAAGIGTLPFTSVYFGKISIISFLANLVIVPLSNLILGIGMLAVGLGYLWSWIADLYSSVTGFLTWLLLKSVEIFGNAPYAYVDSHFSIATSLLFYGAVIAVFHLHNKVFRKRLLIFGLAAVDLWLAADFTWGTNQEKLRVTFMDVGQGDAVVVEFPGGRTLLIDAGPKTFSGDAGARFVAPFLAYSGIHRISDVILTHPHGDHLGGIPHLLRRCSVEEVMDAGTPARSALMAEYIHCVDSLKIPRRILRAGTIVDKFGDARLYVLHPSSPFVAERKASNSNFNNQSVVLKLCYGSTSMLLPGDVERDAEERLVRVYGSFLHADILKLAHHGGNTSSTPIFGDSVRPGKAVISVGANNKFGHPAPSVVQRLRLAGCIADRTDESGAIVFESDGRSWRRIDWR